MYAIQRIGAAAVLAAKNHPDAETVAEWITRTRPERVRVSLGRYYPAGTGEEIAQTMGPMRIAAYLPQDPATKDHRIRVFIR